MMEVIEEPPFKTFFPTILILFSIGLAATDLYLPSLPSITQSLMSSNSFVQLTLTFYLLAFSLSQIIYGPLSDRFGRRKIAILSLSFSFLGSVICMTSFDIYMLLSGRILQGLALGAGATLARAILRDSYSGDRLAHFGSFLSIGTSTFMAVAPALGGYIQDYLGWRMNFLFILLYSILGLIMVLLWLPETNKHMNPLAIRSSVFIKNYLHLLKSLIFIGYSGAASLAFGGLFAYFTVSPFLFQEVIGLTPIEYGWLAFIIGGGIASGGYVNTLLIKMFGRHRMLVLGIGIMFLSGILMLIPALFGILSTVIVMFPMFFYAFGAAMTFGNSFAGAFYPFPKIAGFAGALYGCFQILGASLGSAAITITHEKDQIPLSIILILIGVISYFLQLIAFKASIKMKML